MFINALYDAYPKFTYTESIEGLGAIQNGTAYAATTVDDMVDFIRVFLSFPPLFYL